MKRKYLSLLASVGFAAPLYGSSLALAQVAPPLGVVEQFAVLGASGVTGSAGTGAVINGDVGSSPTATITNFLPSSVSAPFTQHTTNDATVMQAQSDATTAYNNLAAQVCPPANIVAGGILGGLNLGPGVYCMPTGDLTGTLTLTGTSTDVWVFQITLDTLTTAGASNILMAGGANSCNVFWQVSSSATLGGASTFRGSIFALASVTVGDDTNLVGRAVARTGAVTMPGDGGTTIGGCSTLPVPTFSGWVMIILTALLALAGFAAMRKQAI